MRFAFFLLSLTLAVIAEDQFVEYDAINRELARYRERVKILHELISVECPGANINRWRRSIVGINSESQADLHIEKLLYARLRNMLIQCQKDNLVTQGTGKPGQPGKTVTMTSAGKKTDKPTSATTTPTTTTTTPTTTTTTPTTTTTTPTTTTTTPTTTTTFPTPTECSNAINLTESWRSDHTGSNSKPINGNWNCDTQLMVSNGRPWFRFSGAAGSRMLNMCPPSLSCGSAGSIWSDHSIFTPLGQIGSTRAYTRYAGNCQHMTWDISFMKCSVQDNDFIYKFNGDARCSNSFCGMH